jgi:hypothetical protein
VTTTDDQGNFLLSAAPGVYLVVAWRDSDSAQAKAATLDKTAREQSGGVTLTANERKRSKFVCLNGNPPSSFRLPSKAHKIHNM